MLDNCNFMLRLTRWIMRVPFTCTSAWVLLRATIRSYV